LKWISSGRNHTYIPTLQTNTANDISSILASIQIQRWIEYNGKKPLASDLDHEEVLFPRKQTSTIFLVPILLVYDRTGTNIWATFQYTYMTECVRRDCTMFSQYLRHGLLPTGS
jgi:hypothetical protein